MLPTQRDNHLAFDAALFDRDGYFLLGGALDATTIDRLRAAADALSQGRGARAGIRDVLRESDAFSEIANSGIVSQIARNAIGSSAKVVRSILFDKTPDSNWDVIWHQDVTIAVNKRIEVAGFGPWSTKLGTPHVQPTESVLKSMVTLRIHLDDCGEQNGPLLVVPASHHQLVDVNLISTVECEQSAVRCIARAGDILLMRPLLIHASKKAVAASHRRVLHLEFASEPLPGGLEWAGA